MRVFLWVVQIPESVVQVLLVQVWINELQDGRFSRSGISSDPQVWIAFVACFNASLFERTFELLSVHQRVLWKLVEALFILSFLEQFAHFN